MAEYEGCLGRSALRCVRLADHKENEAKLNDMVALSPRLAMQIYRRRSDGLVFVFSGAGSFRRRRVAYAYGEVSTATLGTICGRGPCLSKGGEQTDTGSRLAEGQSSTCEGASCCRAWSTKRRSSPAMSTIRIATVRSCAELRS